MCVETLSPLPCSLSVPLSISLCLSIHLSFFDTPQPLLWTWFPFRYTTTLTFSYLFFLSFFSLFFV